MHVSTKPDQLVEPSSYTRHIQPVGGNMHQPNIQITRCQTNTHDTYTDIHLPDLKTGAGMWKYTHNTLTSPENRLLVCGNIYT